MVSRLYRIGQASRLPLWCGAVFLVLLSACSSSSPPAQDCKDDKGGLTAVDRQLAGYIADDELETAVKTATTMLISRRPRAIRRSAQYWKELALLLLDLEYGTLEKEGAIFAFNSAPLSQLPPKLRDKILHTLLVKYNQSVNRNNMLKQEKGSSQADVNNLKNRVQKLEQLLQDLESIK